MKQMNTPVSSLKMANVAAATPEPEKPLSIVDQHFKNALKLKVRPPPMPLPLVAQQQALDYKFSSLDKIMTKDPPLSVRDRKVIQKKFKINEGEI